MYNRLNFTQRRAGQSRPMITAVPPDPMERERMIDEFIARNAATQGPTVFLLPSQAAREERAPAIVKPETAKATDQDRFLANAYRTEPGPVHTVAARHGVSKHRLYRALELCGFDAKKPAHLVPQRVRRDISENEAQAIAYFFDNQPMTQIAVSKKFKIRRDRLRVLFRAEADKRGLTGIPSVQSQPGTPSTDGHPSRHEAPHPATQSSPAHQSARLSTF